MREYERKAVADAAYDAWRAGRNYDDAWDHAEEAIDVGQPTDRFEAEDFAQSAAFRRTKGGDNEPSAG